METRRIISVRRSIDNVVRSAIVRVAERDSRPGPGKVTDLKGPVHRLCLLQPANEVNVPAIGHRAGCVTNLTPARAIGK